MKSFVKALVLSLLFLCACSSPSAPEFAGGVLATFSVQSERYSIFITNPRTIDDVIALWNGRSNAKIPSGRVVEGRVDYNRAWSWHIDSEDVQMAEVTVELCDGLPSYVEAHLDEWIETVGYFCPWSAVLIDLKDYR